MTAMMTRAGAVSIVQSRTLWRIAITCRFLHSKMSLLQLGGNGASGPNHLYANQYLRGPLEF